MAEAIDLPFGSWTRVGGKKHEFNRIRQVAPVCTVLIAFERWRQCSRRHSAVSCARMAEVTNMPFGLWTRVGRRKHKFNHIRQVAPMRPHGRAHWCHQANAIEPSSAAAMQSYVKLV